MDDRRRDRLLRLIAERPVDFRRGSGWIRVICAVAVEEIEVDGAAISPRRADQEQELVAWSDDWAESLEEPQFTAGDGPGVEAFRAGGAILVSDLTFDEQRRPGFADSVSASGARAAFALMRLRAHAYSRQPPITEVARGVITRQSRFDPHQE